MDNFYFALTPEQLQSFQDRGYLLIRGFFNGEEAARLRQWAQEVHDLPRTADVPWMPYEVGRPPWTERSRSSHATNRKSTRRTSVCCVGRRTLPTPTPGLTASCGASAPPVCYSSWPARRCCSSRKRSTTSWRAAVRARLPHHLEPTLTGSLGGFDPHIDANAYTHVKNIKHLTILAAVDEMGPTNGGLEVVDGSHRMEVPLGADRCIEPAWVKQHPWVPCDLQSGR